MNKLLFALTVSLLLTLHSTASALDITLNKNGYSSIANGQLTGTSISAQTLGTTGANASFTGLVANGTYSLDFFHNAGTGSSDFSFTVNATGTGIQTVNLGGGVNNMVVGFTPGDSTLTLNTGAIVYNANLGQRGNHTVQGLYANSGTNAPLHLGPPFQASTPSIICTIPVPATKTFSSASATHFKRLLSRVPVDQLPAFHAASMPRSRATKSTSAPNSFTSLSKRTLPWVAC